MHSEGRNLLEVGGTVGTLCEEPKGGWFLSYFGPCFSFGLSIKFKSLHHDKL